MPLRPPLISSPLLFALACCVMQGCSVRIPEGKYRCDEQTACPGDWQCRSGYCYSKASASSDQGVSANEARTDAGASMRDAEPPVAGAAANGGDGGHAASGANAASGGHGGGGSGGGSRRGSDAAGAGAADGSGEAGSAAGPGGNDSPECILGEASLGACVLP